MSAAGAGEAVLGDFERAVFDLLKAHRRRHPEADAPELALRLATMAAAVMVSGVDPLRLPFAVERVADYMARQVDILVVEEADPLPGLFDAMHGAPVFTGVDLARGDDCHAEADVVVLPGGKLNVVDIRHFTRGGPSPFRACGAPSLSPPSAGRGEKGGGDAA